MSIDLANLEDSFDNDRAEEILNLSIGKVTHTAELLRKSLYDFDLDTPDGIEKLMSLLPIMDPDILKDIMAEIWPGYKTDYDAKRCRLEIKGYLKDYLESYDDQEAQINEGDSSSSTNSRQSASSTATNAEAQEQASVAKTPGS